MSLFLENSTVRYETLDSLKGFFGPESPLALEWSENTKENWKLLDKCFSRCGAFQIGVDVFEDILLIMRQELECADPSLRTQLLKILMKIVCTLDNPNQLLERTGYFELIPILNEEMDPSTIFFVVSIVKAISTDSYACAGGEEFLDKSCGAILLLLTTKIPPISIEPCVAILTNFIIRQGSNPPMLDDVFNLFLRIMGAYEMYTSAVIEQIRVLLRYPSVCNAVTNMDFSNLITSLNLSIRYQSIKLLKNLLKLGYSLTNEEDLIAAFIKVFPNTAQGHLKSTLNLLVQLCNSSYIVSYVVDHNLLLYKVIDTSIPYVSVSVLNLVRVILRNGLLPLQFGFFCVLHNALSTALSLQNSKYLIVALETILNLQRAGMTMNVAELVSNDDIAQNSDPDVANRAALFLKDIQEPIDFSKFPVEDVIRSHEEDVANYFIELPQNNT